MAANYTGVATNVQAPGPAPGPGVSPIISLPQDTDGNTTANWYQALKEPVDWIDYLNKQLKYPLCDPSDGNVTLDGVVAAPSWATKSGTVYTLTRDTALNNLTVTGAGVVLNTANFR